MPAKAAVKKPIDQPDDDPKRAKPLTLEQMQRVGRMLASLSSDWNGFAESLAADKFDSTLTVDGGGGVETLVKRVRAVFRVQQVTLPPPTLHARRPPSRGGAGTETSCSIALGVSYSPRTASRARPSLCG